MWSRVNFFIAIIAVICPFNNVESAPSQALDINQILEFVQQQKLNTGASKQRRLQLRKYSSDSDSDSDSDDSFTDKTDDSDYNRIARLRKERIIDLIETVANEKNNRLRNNNRIITYRKEKPNYGQNTYVSRSEKYDNSQGYNNNIKTQILEKIFPQGLIDEERKTKPRGDYQKTRLKPYRLLPLTMNNVTNYDKNDDAIGLEDYSKVYIVLNPQAVRKSKNKNALNDLISKILSLSSPTSINEAKRNPRRYKGFVVNEKNPHGRSRRSRQIYAPRDSNGDEYVQKKSRNGGYPSAGRTGIPYVRQRGNIYERDSK